MACPVVLFLDMVVAVGLVVFTLPFFVQSLRAAAIAVGVATTLFSFFQFMMNPFWGNLSDRIGRKRVMCIQQVGAAAGMAIVASATVVEHVYIGRAISGLFGATFMLTNAYVTDASSEDERTRSLGYLAVGLSLAFLVGPVVGGVLFKVSPSLPFFVGSAAAITNVLFIYFILPEIGREERSERAGEAKLTKANVRRALSDRRARGSILANFLTFTGLAGFQVCFVFMLNRRFGLTPEQVGIFMALTSVSGVIAQLTVGKLARRFTTPTILKAATPILAVCAFASVSMPTIALTVLAQLICAFCQMLAVTSIISLASMGAPKDLRGTTMGFLFAVQSLALVLWPPTYGALYDRVSPWAPFILATVFFIITAAVAWVWNWSSPNGSAPRG